MSDYGSDIEDTPNQEFEDVEDQDIDETPRDAGDDVEEMVEDQAGEEEEPEEVEEIPEEAFPEVRNKNFMRKIVIAPDRRRTSNVLSKFEMTEIISVRSAQIASDGICMVNTADLDDSVKMAKRELMLRKCPLMYERGVGDGVDADGTEIEYVEHWDPNEMQFPIHWEV